MKNAVNAGISLFNRFINWINSKLVISWPSIPFLGISAGSYQLLRIPNIPLLAQGAVIPPNREFLAVLGDQKSGTNIETPLATMVQAFKQAMNETGGMGGRQITVVMQLDHRELGRAVYNLNNEETQRVGVKLAGVKA